MPASTSKKQCSCALIFGGSSRKPRVFILGIPQNPKLPKKGPRFVGLRAAACRDAVARRCQGLGVQVARLGLGLCLLFCFWVFAGRYRVPSTPRPPQLKFESAAKTDLLLAGPAYPPSEHVHESAHKQTLLFATNRHKWSAYGIHKRWFWQ